jgi:hypothetical protein
VLGTWRLVIYHKMKSLPFPDNLPIDDDRMAVEYDVTVVSHVVEASLLLDEFSVALGT